VALSAAERVLRAKIAAYSRWSKTPDRDAAMQPLWRGFDARFQRELDALEARPKSSGARSAQRG